MYQKNGVVSSAQFYNAGSPAAAKRYRYEFGGASYDALNRLKSADFSYYSGGWVTTAAYDLANITYDAAGNLTALQRYRETGTLIDNLTYSYPGSSNRLSSVADAINTTSETWDAEDGSFTYDANGNMKTAPAPYSVTAVTYDHQNLPLSLTSSGTTTTYRYNEAGQRITKRVGTANPEHYILDGATTLAVFTRDPSGNPTSWYFNVLAGDKVVGRQPNTGSRSYYHTDLLGSTRSVTQGTSVVESYDYEPWGLLMPGRTLGIGTKEGFTGKELDSETGLGYFGARYYMAALGRWGSADPLAEKHLEWSPYNYVLNNPLTLIDPDGRQVMANSNAYWEGVAVDGFQQGGFRGAAKVAAGMAAMTAFEFFGMNQAETGFGAMAEGNWVSGTASVGMAVAGNLPGLNFTKFGRAAGSVDDAARAVGKIGDDAADGAAEAFHYTRSELTESIANEGLREGSYVTSTGSLSPLQAQLDLALPPNRGLRDAVFRVDLDGLRKAGFEVPDFSQVGRNFNMPGGGTEIRFGYVVPKDFISVVQR
jgi:RHS repeat-associated protein